MAYIIITIILWLIFWKFVPLKSWRDYYPTLLFSGLLGTICDLLGVVFKQWVYYGPVVGGLSLWSDLGIAVAEGGLFIRFFPAGKNRWYQMGYLLFWSILNGIAEWLFVMAGWIGYHHWNPLRATLFYVFFFGFIWLQEFWYNGTNRLVIKEE